MSKVNTKTKIAKVFTHEGAPAKIINAEQQLKRSVLSCFLWEDTFYESGEDIAKRISKLVASCKPDFVAKLAIQAREEFKLRHVPLLLVREMARLKTHRHLVAETLEKVIQRADELSEFVSIYWKGGKEPLSAQVKKGLAKAFCKFNEYALAKYNQDNAIKLRDVLFLCHAKPESKTQANLWKKLVENKLKTPDTWEVAISACKTETEKKKEWTRLLEEEALGALALLRNLRNMNTAGVEKTTIKKALKEMKVDRVLPFRFLSAAKYAPNFEPELEQAMFKCTAEMEKLPGKTVLLVDTSGSMVGTPVSNKSDLDRLDAACGLAILLRELCDDVEVLTFSDRVTPVRARKGFALKDEIKSAPSGGTNIGSAVDYVRTKISKYDRLIVITDEQSHDRVGNPGCKKAYMVNVATYKNGVGYGVWNHIDGFSEAIVRWIWQFEKD